MSEEEKQDQVTETAEQEQNSEAELTVQDLNALKQIIDVSSQRGAFRPNEMATVGQVYNKLESFLSAVTAQQSNNQG